MGTPVSQLKKEARAIVDSFHIDELRRSGLFPLDGEYFPAIFYPPIPMCPSGKEEELFAGVLSGATRPLSFYVHIPFCPFRCIYCHWMVSTGDSTEAMATYVDAIDRELELYQAKLGAQNLRPRSILLGGGTPTMLSPRLIEKLFAIIRSRLDLSQCTQIIAEAEPTTVLGEEGLEKLQALRAGGAGRISFGAQILDEQMLKSMGRRHTPREVGQAVDQARRAGFKSISIDLIFGFPGSTVDKWIATLEAALSLDIDACQQYRLRIVPHGDKAGAIGKVRARKPESFPELEDIYMMKEMGILYCREKGYLESCRRVFSRGEVHDSDYLRDHNDRLADVLGVGTSAWSNIQGHLSINTSASMEAYYSLLEQGRLPIDRGIIRSDEETCRWAMVLPLKHHGVSKSYYQEVTGRRPHDVFGKKIETLKSFGLIEETEDALRLTTKGKFFADEVVIQFYHPRFLPFPEANYTSGPLNPYNAA
jgi:oxygen-independent coproporphyrinogen-3 oxidase